MILPDKNLTLRYSLLGAGTRLISELKYPQTVSSLWEKVHSYEEIKTFERYVLLLDLLYIIGLVDFEKGLIVKVLR